ncbi:DUF4153 domain-containing protein [Streptomyces nitrosporeus]|uniref:DUF4153 domain-containing protein n=1 Tax=Streptomyces nitrosporeus TaxID=28894 RepID=UPI00332170B7
MSDHVSGTAGAPGTPGEPAAPDAPGAPSRQEAAGPGSPGGEVRAEGADPAAADGADRAGAEDAGADRAGRAGADGTGAEKAGPAVPAQGTGPDAPAAPARLQGPRPSADPWRRPAPRQPEPGLLTRLRPPAPSPVGGATLLSVLATGLACALLLGDGLGVNLLIVAVPAALAAYFAARAAGRRLRPWTAVWAAGGLGLLAVPALRDAGWPTFLAVVSALALGSLALHGGRRWPGVLHGSWGLLTSVVPGARWGLRGVRERAGDSRGRVRAVVRSTAVALVLLIVFGALFAAADAAFADLLGRLTPDVTLGDSPWRVLLFLLGILGALAAAYTAAAPVRWDRVTVAPGRARKRAEWAVPLIVLDLLFAVFVALQLVVLLGGYDKVLKETGLLRAEYARQGFWQLLWVTLLTLAVIVLALRWAPRGRPGDRVLVRSVLGVLGVLTLVVVASALRRMDLYVDAFGLTRLRISVAAVELWLGVVVLLILLAGVLGARLLPRAVAASAAAGVLAFGLASPDGVIAGQNVQRYEDGKPIDIGYLRDLSADAVPALDKLPEPLRSCSLERIERILAASGEPWYATSLGEARARDILEKRPAKEHGSWCYGAVPGFGERDADGDSREDPDAYDPY